MSMRPLGTVLKISAIVVAIIVLGVLIGRFAARQDPLAPDPAPAVSALAESGAEATNRSTFFKKYAEPRVPEIETNLTSTDVSAPATNGMANWEDKIDEVLSSDAPVPDMAKKLLELFPKFPEVGQVEVAQHISNLLDDDDYAPMGRYLTNASMPASVLQVLMDDALNRPTSKKLPLFLEVARNPSHPNAAEAKAELEFYLDEDYGTNWMLWGEKMQEWLKENPD
jgi:hypothetical protein